MYCSIDSGKGELPVPASQLRAKFVLLNSHVPCVRHGRAGVLKKFQAMGVMAKDNWNDKLPDVQ